MILLIISSFYSENIQEISLFIHLKRNRATRLTATNLSGNILVVRKVWAGEQARQHRADDKLIMQI